MFAVRFSGDRELDRALRVLEKATPKPFLKGVMKASAKPLVKNMKTNVRKDTGELRKSIKARLKLAKKGLIIMKVGPGKDQFWGMFLEFGTAHHSPFPWMRPAWDGKKDKTLALITAGLALQLNRVAKKISRKVSRGKKLTRFELRLLGV